MCPRENRNVRPRIGRESRRCFNVRAGTCDSRAAVMRNQRMMLCACAARKKTPQTSAAFFDKGEPVDPVLVILELFLRGLQRFDLLGQARDFARSGFLVQNAFVGAALDFRLSGLQGFCGGFVVTFGNRFFYLADGRAHLRRAALVFGSDTGIAADAFFGGLMDGHSKCSFCVKAVKRYLVKAGHSGGIPAHGRIRMIPGGIRISRFLKRFIPKVNRREGFSSK